MNRLIVLGLLIGLTGLLVVLEYLASGWDFWTQSKLVAFIVITILLIVCEKLNWFEKDVEYYTKEVTK